MFELNLSQCGREPWLNRFIVHAYSVYMYNDFRDPMNLLRIYCITFVYTFSKYIFFYVRVVHKYMQTNPFPVNLGQGVFYKLYR